MARNIRISFEETSVSATLNDSQTAEAIWRASPFESTANRWGDEIYFSIPVRIPEAPDARQTMAVGELGYWPVGAAFCLFFGPTPVSEGDEPRAYSNVNPFGQLDGDATVLRQVKDGERVRVEKGDSPSA